MRAVEQALAVAFFRVDHQHHQFRPCGTTRGNTATWTNRIQSRGFKPELPEGVEVGRRCGSEQIDPLRFFLHRFGRGRSLLLDLWKRRCFGCRRGHVGKPIRSVLGEVAIDPCQLPPLQRGFHLEG